MGGRKGGRKAVLKRLLKEMTVQAVETEKKKLEKIQGTSVDAGSIVFVDELVVGFERRRNEGWLLEFGWNAGRILEPIPKVRNGRTQRFGRTRNRVFSLKH